MTQVTFDELVATHRRELLVHCYRLLGSVTDAEDVLQETLLAAWRGLDAFEGRASVRSWLYRIATNRCVNALRDRGRRIPAEPRPPFEPPEPSRRGQVTWLQPYPDDLLPDTDPGPEARYTGREAIGLAFVSALQRLTPRQAAVLVLCDVLGYPLAAVAPMLDTTPTAVKGLLQRARGAIERHRDPAGEAPPGPGSTQERRLVDRFAEAFAADDIDTVVSLLTDEAWLAMPPAPHEYHGPAAIAAFLRASAAWRAGQGLRVRLDPARMNGQPAFVSRLVGDAYERPGGLIVLTPAGDRVHGMTLFLHDI
ncbi:RNA polymerase sigma-70 factor, ECF subfamily [Asanoa hainanensis]|uniref:RNA polymerase sigma factor n=1 Tax=Asanoa hainanensis TaxID=560556 RepID=A0A239M7C1_9ACTN|nr:RNA polymerase sigma-70 factor, ECF subfamily [Asanoa hainanensis]